MCTTASAVVCLFVVRIVRSRHAVGDMAETYRQVVNIKIVLRLVPPQTSWACLRCDVCEKNRKCGSSATHLCQGDQGDDTSEESDDGLVVAGRARVGGGGRGNAAAGDRSIGGPGH